MPESVMIKLNDICYEVSQGGRVRFQFPDKFFLLHSLLLLSPYQIHTGNGLPVAGSSPGLTVLNGA